MACFLVPAAQAVVTTAIQKVAKEKESNYGEDSYPQPEFSLRELAHSDNSFLCILIEEVDFTHIED